jgi:uncharacterized protein YndB with AHSA1/START domain
MTTRHVLRVEEVLPCPADRVWRALTDPDLIARWLMPNDFKLEAGHRFAIDSDPIRRRVPEALLTSRRSDAG